MSPGPSLIVLGVGNVIWGWAVGTYLVPALRRASTRAQRGDERTSRWARAVRGLDRLGIGVSTVAARVLLILGAVVAVAGIVVWVVTI